MSEKGRELHVDREETKGDNPPPPPYPQSGNGYPPQQGYVNPVKEYPCSQQFQGPPPYHGYVVHPPPPVGVQPAQVITIAPQPPRKDYMLPAVLVTLFCFFPTGIIAIMRASEARSAALYGDMDYAERHNKSAKKMIKISIIVGVLCYAALIALMVFYVNFIGRIVSQNYHH